MEPEAGIEHEVPKIPFPDIRRVVGRLVTSIRSRRTPQQPEHSLQPAAAPEALRSEEHTPAVIQLPSSDKAIPQLLAPVLEKLRYTGKLVFRSIDSDPTLVARAFNTGTDRNSQSRIYLRSRREKVAARGLNPATDAGRVTYVKIADDSSGIRRRRPTSTILIYSFDTLEIIHGGENGALAMFKSEDPEQIRRSLLAIISPIPEEEIRRQAK